MKIKNQYLKPYENNYLFEIDGNGLFLKVCLLSYEYDEVKRIRNEVFIQEQHVKKSLEFVHKEEKNSVHFLIIKDNIPLGTIRYQFTKKGIKLQRFAILKEYRSQGIGRKVFIFMRDLLMSQYPDEDIYFHAQYNLVPFYESIGFIKIDEPFLEAGMKHQLMKLKK